LSEAAFLPKNPQGWVRVFVFFELVFGKFDQIVSACFFLIKELHQYLTNA